MQLKRLTAGLPDPSVILIVGRRGSGKDAFAHRLAQVDHQQTGKKIYVHYDPGKYNLPNYYRKFDAVPVNNSIHMVSDAHLVLYAREWSGDFNKQMDKLQTLARQKGIDIIYTTQQTSRLDRNIVAGVDAIIFREPGLMQERMTRPEIRPMVEEANRHFQDEKGKTLGQREKWRRAVAFTHTGKHLIKDIKLPYYWTQDLSKIYGSDDSESTEDWKPTLVIASSSGSPRRDGRSRREKG